MQSIVKMLYWSRSFKELVFINVLKYLETLITSKRVVVVKVILGKKHLNLHVRKVVSRKMESFLFNKYLYMIYYDI